ncbi:hypothetical protein RCH23_000749 [Cryobacterium sp. CAN_C3]|uniref:hypothetical protein n=1 Tax=unclassified Cryobacterium TaxID=2649013 RepID=UPI0018C92A18|nr:hypothetical protein [Cryobacterium sp. CAN_C3]MEC5153383.1 hypothetical protein [Cryobacterium sp. CAN_C3]
MSQPGSKSSFDAMPGSGSGSGLDPGDALILSSDLTAALGEDFRLRRESTRGRLLRVSHGLYYPSARWNLPREDQRYPVRVRGAARTRRPHPPPAT